MKTEDRQISDQAARLYEAAKVLKGVEGKSAVARLLNIAPQVINHWEGGRPISNEGLMTALEYIGCDAIWLRDGTGDMRGGKAPETANLDAVIELFTLYAQATITGKEQILDLARIVPKTNVAGITSLTRNQP